MLRGGSGRGSTTQRQAEVQATQAPQRSRYIFKDALIVAQTAPDEYTLYTIHSYNDRECVCIDIEDQSERRFPWEHIYLLNHQRNYTGGAEVLALSKEGTEWLTAYYPARVYPSSRYTSSDEVFSVLFDSDFAELGDQATRKELPERAKNLYGNDVPTVILKTSALPFVPEALAYQEHKSILKAERKLQKRNVAATAAAASLYGGADPNEQVAAMGLHSHSDSNVAHLTDGMAHESAAARSLKSTSSLAEAYANSSTPNPIPYWRVHRPHLSVEQLERIAFNVLSQVGKRVRLVPSLHDFMERKKQHQMQQEDLQLYQSQLLQEQQQQQQMLLLQQQQQLQLLQEQHQDQQQLEQQQVEQEGELQEGSTQQREQGISDSNELLSNENADMITKTEDMGTSSTFVSGIGTTARWDAARSIVQNSADDEKTTTTVETVPPLVTGMSEVVEADSVGKLKTQSTDDLTKIEHRPEDSTEQPRSTTAPFVALF